MQLHFYTPLSALLTANILPLVWKKIHWLKIQDRIIYTILMLTYKSYYNMTPLYLCELIYKKESHVNTRLGSDHHQLIMPPISQLVIVLTLSLSVHSFILLHANGTNWVNISEHLILIVSGRVLKQYYLHNNMDADCIYIYIIVFLNDVITVDYCKCILLYSPLNSYLYVHWILDFK